MNKFEIIDDYYEINKPRIHSVEEWVDITKKELASPPKFDFVKKVLVEMYKIENHTMFCHTFEKEHDVYGLNLQVWHFKNRMEKYGYVFERQRGQNDRERCWNIPFYSNKDINNEAKGHFSWVLRKELVSAMEQVMPEIKNYKYSQPEKCYDKSIENKKCKEIVHDIKNSQINDSKSTGNSTKHKKTDYIAKQIENKKIGDVGEKKIVEYEKSYLINKGRVDLAERVYIVDSDDYGYDIVSFFEDGSEKHIEVKTTTRSTDNVMFHLTANEKNTLESDNSYQLYYLYDIYGEKEVKLKKFDNETLRIIVKEFIRPIQYIVEFD